MIWLLPLFGVLFVVAASVAILLPWARRTGDLFSSWNLFLLGSINYVGLASVTNSRSLLPNDFNRGEIPLFVLGGILLYGTAALTYFKGNWIRERALRGLVPCFGDTGPIAVRGVIALTFATLACLVGSRLPVVTEIARIILAPMAIAVTALVFCWVISRPANVVGWLILPVVAGAAFFVASLNGIGRRDLLGLILLFPIVVYWQRLRVLPVGRTAVVLAVLGFGGITVLNGFTSIRHVGIREGVTGVELAQQRVAALPGAVIDSVVNRRSLTEGGDALIGGQNAVYCSLLTIKLVVTTEELPVYPLQSVAYTLLHPIPRRYWSDKPRAFGEFLPAFVGKGYVNWGPGVIGHGFYDGGIPVLIFYGFLIGGGTLLFDTRLRADPNNPLRLAMLSSISGQVVAFSRGDIGLFSVLILGALTVEWVVLRVAGTRRVLLERWHAHAAQFGRG